MSRKILTIPFPKLAIELVTRGVEHFVALLARMSVTPNSVTLSSLFLSILAAASLAFHNLGLALCLTILTFAMDMVDGMLARTTGQVSQAGKVMDSSVDRYTEGAIFLGLVLHFEGDVWVTLICLFALFGSLMVSYTSAKFEARRLEPFGGMRRQDRCVLLMLGILACWLTTVFGASFIWQKAPIYLVMASIGLGSHITIFKRLAFLHARDAG